MIAAMTAQEKINNRDEIRNQLSDVRRNWKKNNSISL